MITIGFIIGVALLYCNVGIDRQANAQRESDKETGADKQIVPQVLAKSDGCLSLVVWLVVIGFLVALASAAAAGGV